MIENCAICLHPITNPICGKCFMKQILYWLNDKKVTGAPKEFILKQIRKKTYFEGNYSRCVSCGKKEVALCSHCFFVISSRILYELNFPESVIEEFDDMFSYIYKKDILDF